MAVCEFENSSKIRSIYSSSKMVIIFEISTTSFKTSEKFQIRKGPRLNSKKILQQIRSYKKLVTMCTHFFCTVFTKVSPPNK